MEGWRETKEQWLLLASCLEMRRYWIIMDYYIMIFLIIIDIMIDVDV